jgi:hypothetical protein
MSRESPNSGSLRAIEDREVTHGTGALLSPKLAFVAKSTELLTAEVAVRSTPQKTSFEVIDADELARRWNLPVSWIRSHTRRRTLDEIPHLKCGKYVRFRWASPELEHWLSSHGEGLFG